MDKQTIDYAMNKLTEKFNQIKPDAMELGQEYIDYSVFKATIPAIGLPVLCIILAIICRYAWFKLDKNDNWTPVCVLSGIIALVTAGMSPVVIYEAMLANSYPLMWTIEQLIK